MDLYYLDILIVQIQSKSMILKKMGLIILFHLRTIYLFNQIFLDMK